MVVGILRLTLLIPGSRSLKDKRRAVHKIVDRARGHFNVSAAEVGDNELWQKAQLGFAVVSNDRMFVNEVLEKVVRDVERMAVAEIVERELEVESYATMSRALGQGIEDAKFAGEGGDEREGQGGGERGDAGAGGPGGVGEREHLGGREAEGERGAERRSERERRLGARRAEAGAAPGGGEADWLVPDDLSDERGGKR
jgi:uncharacterized protein YlxP (DUF503 family)